MPENITISSQPPKVALLDEGLNFSISSARSWSPAKADLNLRFPNSSTAYLDKYFEVSLPDRDLKFYFKASPDSSGLQLLNWQSGETITTFLDRILTELQLNYYINTYYDVTRSTAPGINFNAKTAGLGFDIDFKATDVSGLQKLSAGSGDEGTNPGDYKIYVAPCLYADGQTDAEALGEDLPVPNSSQVAETDLADYFTNLLKSSFHHPISDDSVVFEVEDGCIRYFIRYAEYMNSGVQKVLDNYTEEFYVIAGGLKMMDSDFLKKNGHTWWNYDQVTLKFLSWAPLTKVTYPETTERLYFLKTQSEIINLYTKATTAEGEGEAVYVISIDLEAYNIIEIACGLNELYPDTDHTTILSYDVWLEDTSANVISEVRTFSVDQNTYLYKRTFVFKNSFGMSEVLTCVGDLSIQDKIKREEVEIMQDGAFRSRYNQIENEAGWKISSGWLNGVETRLWLEELLLSSDVYLLSGDMVLPVRITTSSINRYEDREYMHELTFSFKPDYRDSRYSNLANPSGGDFVLVDEEWRLLTDELDQLLLDA